MQILCRCPNVHMYKKKFSSLIFWQHGPVVKGTDHGYNLLKLNPSSATMSWANVFNLVVVSVSLSVK